MLYWWTGKVKEWNIKIRINKIPPNSDIIANKV